MIQSPGFMLTAHSASTTGTLIVVVIKTVSTVTCPPRHREGAWTTDPKSTARRPHYRLYHKSLISCSSDGKRRRAIWSGRARMGGRYCRLRGNGGQGRVGGRQRRTGGT